ncbi:MAG: NAD(+)--dinitrogen-reductase ADP-D-ribosyltransferase [Zoogloeaceae bacterium]|jgi:NAD+--dinitrogen-reductase ADP-D-ribosyltransferase|nr:NAD(+)--dinitrogen-reductase ADP-D-ribosyltransferase [Zoogloeaceae bacterium]
MEHDNASSFCRAWNKNPTGTHSGAKKPGHNAEDAIRLPETACLPINRCNLPAAILGSLAYQKAPLPLELDGVRELHRDLFRRLEATPHAKARAEVFRDYMTVHFRLEHLEEAGLATGTAGAKASRARTNYMSLIRGWCFDANGHEGAALKGWVESRFGLLPRYHGGLLRAPEDEAHRRYRRIQAQMCYGANALEAQLDLVYAYCQYEFARAHPEQTHLQLYRGVNRLEEYEILGGARKEPILLLNNLSSCTATRERAEEFGDHILTLEAPIPKILFHCQLLPFILKSEDEFLLIGGLYRTQCSHWP